MTDQPSPDSESGAPRTVRLTNRMLHRCGCTTAFDLTNWHSIITNACSEHVLESSRV